MTERKPTAVILDSFAVNPGDISWSALEDICDIRIYDRTPSDLILERAAGAEIVITNKTPLTAETIKALPSLRFIDLLSTGYNIADYQFARTLGIPVSNVPEYSTDDVAQMTMALLLEVCLRVGDHSRAVHGGAWARSADFCFSLYPLLGLKGRTMGIVGDGKIGRAVGKIAEAFGMKTLYCGQTMKPGRVTFDEVLAESDVISVHCPLTEETTGLINKETIAKMKDGAILINTSRGPVINESDLRDALVSGKLHGAGLDVLSVEPASEDNPLIGLDNCIITPHIAWAAQPARARLIEETVMNVKAYIDGSPRNVVN